MKHDAVTAFETEASREGKNIAQPIQRGADC